jgi:hypothetical protein
LLVQHMVLHLVHTLPTLIIVIVCSIFQFEVLLIISRPPLQDFLFVAYNVSFLISISTGKSLFMQFLFVQFYLNATWKFTSLCKFMWYVQFHAIWHRQYMIIFSLTWCGIHDWWLLVLFCRLGESDVTGMPSYTCMDWLH